MHCKNCKHFIPSTPEDGRCRRYPPTVHLVTNANGDSDWINERPYVGKNETCGEFTAANPVR